MMYNRSIAESNLKLLIENNGFTALEKDRANMVLKLLNKTTGLGESEATKSLTYDEAILLYQSAAETLSNLPTHDVAWPHFSGKVIEYLTIASSLNIADDLGRHDHLIPVRVLVSVGVLTVEADIHIPRLYYTERRRDEYIRSRIQKNVAKSSEFAGSMRHGNEMEFVEI